MLGRVQVKWDIVTTNIINTLKLHSLWLLDLAKTLPPSTQLDGFDISDSGYPPREWLPSHVSMQILNAFEDPPQTLWGKYDIVHLRLFLIVVNENNVAPLLDHCMKLLSESHAVFGSGPVRERVIDRVQNRVGSFNGMSTTSLLKRSLPANHLFQQNTLTSCVNL